jgi:hypothetical protein
MILSQMPSGTVGASSKGVLAKNGTKVLRPPVKGRK